MDIVVYLVDQATTRVLSGIYRLTGVLRNTIEAFLAEFDRCGSGRLRKHLKVDVSPAKSSSSNSHL